MIELNVATLSSGALVERLQEEIERAIANITDPNTPAKKPRKVKMEMTIKPNEQRNMAEVVISTASTLVAPKPLETSIYIGADPKTGKIGASEVVGQEDPGIHLLPGIEERQHGKLAANVKHFQQ